MTSNQHRTNDNKDPKAETLDQALGRIWETQWRFKRSGPTLKSQAEIAVYTIKRLVTGLSGLEPRAYLGVTPQDVTQMHIQQATSGWYADGLSPATINKRLNCLSKLGVKVDGCRVTNPKQLKWHLKESDKAEVLLALRVGRGRQWSILADLIEWTTLTGLRIEESLRLTWGDIGSNPVTVSVPGLKTSTSQATLPLGSTPEQLLRRLALDAVGAAGVRDAEKVFKTDYEEMHACWDCVRKLYGWDKDSTATLKALRRSAARYLHVDCGMPLHMVQQYLRHESMDTTLEYLRLTGGYGTEEMRRYLK